VKPACSGPVLLLPIRPLQADRAIVTEMNMRRVYLRKNFHYESMIGTTFKRLGAHLDTCCLANSGYGGCCPARTQCREWWDNQCKVARGDLGPAEIEGLIWEFERLRAAWLRQSSSLSRGNN
jgi:hypothetical protein